MGQTGSTTQKAAKPSTSLHLRDKKELAGVGVIFRKNPEGLLVVKDVVGGSSADESGLIEPGDVLTQVDDVKVTKSSIADISGMVLGTPGESVKLKFTRTVGKSKKKYKVVLKRTVRASLEPTYHVQRDGINTKVTHIHLDCLQNQDEPKPAAAANEARDVLDADGNVVGPGLLQRARAASKGVDVPGVERIDPNHPAWPGAKKKTRIPPASPPIRAEEQAAPPPPAPDNLTPITPASESEGASLLDAFAAPEEGLPESEPAPVPLPEPTTAAGSAEEPPPPLVPADERQPAVAVAVLEEEEDEKDSGAPDWEGLAQSRLAQFEAKARDGKPKKKAVDLEKEWARSAAVQIAAKTEDSTADVATRTPSAGSSSSATAARGGGGASESTLPAMEAKGEEKVTKESFKPVSFNVEEAEKPAAAAAPAKSSPFGDKVVKSTPTKTAAETPKKMSAKGDLAAMMAARRKAQEETEEDGFYF